MVNRAPLIASLATIAGMLAVSAAVWTQIPNAARLPVHWDIHSAPNGYAPKAVALLFLPALALILTAMFAGLAFALPGGRHDALNGPAYRIGWIATVLLLAIVHAMVVLAARGVQLDVTGNTAFAVALVLIALGNFLGKVRANPWLGIRTPWTRTSTYAWEKSNRLSGRLLVAVSLATLGAIAIFGPVSAVHVLIGGVAVTAFAGIAASYRYWRRAPDRAIAP